MFRGICVSLARGVVEGRCAVLVASLVEEAMEFVSVVGLVVGGAIEQGAQGGHAVAEGAVVEGGQASVVEHGAVG